MFLGVVLFLAVMVWAWWAVARCWHDVALWHLGQHSAGRMAWLAWHATCLLLAALMAFFWGLGVLT